VIDLHMHTTASDGWLSASELVQRAAAVGLRTISVTDHDTVASVESAAVVARALGLRLVPGIEITSVDGGRDVHLLGYFFDTDHPGLAAFLTEQRAARAARVRAIGVRLAELGAPIDVDRIVRVAADRPGRSVGRPQLARALVAARHVRSTQQAFDQFLATGRPAFVPRVGPGPAEVVALVHEAGGIVSVAHPAVTQWDEGIGPLAQAGLDAIEAFHSDHTPEHVRVYRAMAERLQLGMSGGSDFHGDDPSAPPGMPPRRARLGAVSLAAELFDALEDRARRHRGSA